VRSEVSQCVTVVGRSESIIARRRLPVVAKVLRRRAGGHAWAEVQLASAFSRRRRGPAATAFRGGH
jgi:hypothetical protein